MPTLTHARQQTVATQPRTHQLLAGLLLACAFLMLLTTPAHARNVVSREAPAFPSDALDDGVDSGSVKARLSVAADGSVTKVDILSADPKGYFEKAVTRALSRWKYEPGAAENIDTVVTFKN